VLWKGPECRSWALDRRRGAVDELILAERGCGSHCGGGVNERTGHAFIPSAGRGERVDASGRYGGA
jgi:hypothetical protein